MRIDITNLTLMPLSLDLPTGDGDMIRELLQRGQTINVGGRTTPYELNKLAQVRQLSAGTIISVAFVAEAGDIVPTPTGGGGGGYNQVQSSGSNIAQRTTIDFRQGLSAVDSGAITRVQPVYGAGANTIAQGNDARFPTAGEKAALAGTNGVPGGGNPYVTDSDPRNINARAPTAHATSHEPGGLDAMTIDAAVGVGSLRTLGTGAQQATAGSDTRIPTQAENDALQGTSGAPSNTNRYVTDQDARNVDPRSPTAHATSHEVGGSDPLTGNLDANARVGVRRNSAGSTFARRRVNLIEGSNITIGIADDAGGEEVDVTIASSGGAGGYSTIQDEGSPLTQRSVLNFVGSTVAATDNVGNSSTDITLPNYGTSGVTTVNAGDTPAVGASADVARVDHEHGVATATAVGLDASSTSAEGNSTSLARANHTHAIDVTTGSITTIQPDDSAADGTAIGVARRDHRHAIATATAVDIGTANTEGASTSFARADHVHNTPFSAVTAALAAANAAVSFNGQRLTSVGDPTGDQDAATRLWSLLRSWRRPVRVATITTLPAYTRTTNVITASANGALPAIDGVTLTTTDRLLLKNGAAGADNGIYTVTDLGSAGTPFVLTRGEDSDASNEVFDGMTLSIREGTLAGQIWALTTNDPVTLNTTALTFTQVGGPAASTTQAGLISAADQTKLNNVFPAMIREMVFGGGEFGNASVTGAVSFDFATYNDFTLTGGITQRAAQGGLAYKIVGTLALGANNVVVEGVTAGGASQAGAAAGVAGNAGNASANPSVMSDNAQTAGGTAGTAGAAGGNGGTGGNGSSSAGASNSGGSGGAGGGSGGGAALGGFAGGAGGVATASTGGGVQVRARIYFEPYVFTTLNTSGATSPGVIGQGGGGGGAGGGGRSGTGTGGAGGTGGSGGTGGGLISLRARNITGTGTIRSNGSNGFVGLAGSAATGPGDAGGGGSGGGGGGGSGGMTTAVYETIGGSVVLQSNGGTGGLGSTTTAAGVTGGGNGGAGGNGGNGLAGIVVNRILTGN